MSILSGSVASVAAVDVDRTHRIARLAARLTGAPIAVVLVEPAGGERGLAAHVPDDGATTPITAAVAAAGAAVCRRVAREATPRAVSDTAQQPDDSSDGLVLPPGVAAWAGVPVTADDGTAIGAVCVFDNAARPWPQLADLTDLVTALDLGASPAPALPPEPRDGQHEELARENAFLNAVLEHLTDGVAACDADGTLVYFNPALREIHGLPERRIAREEWAQAYDLYDRDGKRLLGADEIPLARASAGQHVHGQHMVVHNRRGTRHFLADGSPITDASGDMLGAVVLMRDITSEQRRRRIRTAHLAVATALSHAPEYAEGIAEALTHLRGALDLTTADFVTAHSRPAPDIDQRVVHAVIRSGAAVQAPLSEPYSGYVICVPVSVVGSTTAVLYLAGRVDQLLDDLSATTAEGVATLLGRWFEQRRAAQLDTELHSVRHDVARLVKLTDDYVWSAEILPSGFSALRDTTSPAGVIGAAEGMSRIADDEWLPLLQDAVHPDDLGDVLAWVERTKLGRPGEVVCRIRGVDGVVRRVMTRCTVRSENGRRYIDGLSRSLTRRAGDRVEG